MTGAVLLGGLFFCSTGKSMPVPTGDEPAFQRFSRLFYRAKDSAAIRCWLGMNPAKQESRPH